MSKHTPLPWRVESDNDARDLYVVAKEKDDFGNRVATVETSGFGSAKQADWANARLIAAAPDLLAACKAFVRDRATCPTTNGDDLTAFEAMQQAIAKAEGSQS